MSVKKVLGLSLIIIFLFGILAGCEFGNYMRLTDYDIIDSLEHDYGLVVEKNYCFFDLSEDILKYTQFADYQEIDKKLSKWSNSIVVSYMKIDDSKSKLEIADKFIFSNRLPKKHIKINGKKLYAEIKDYIYISDFPFTYTYDEMKVQCEGIADENIKNELLSAFRNSTSSFYADLKGNSFLNNFTNEDKILINDLSVEKGFVFILSNYYFFYIKESGLDKLYIYKEYNNGADSQIIYPSSMTKEAFINHLKTL